MPKKKSAIFAADIGANNEIVDNVIVPKAEPTVINIDEDGIEVTTKVTDEVERLTKENASLADKLASYIEEADKAKALHKSLQDELDRLTFRVSELTFENAHLKSELSKINTDGNAVLTEPTAQFAQPAETQKSKCTTTKSHNASKTIRYPYYMKNGYSDWN